MTSYRIARLRNQHRWLEEQIHEEMRRPEPDILAIQDLKRRKLQVRDEIFLAEAGLAPLRL
uniref:YdcH family protein n=1 Tax=Phenylobacterium sp. TaxID=1871053 RepID=UPI002FE16570